MRGHIEKRGKNSYSIAVSLGKDATTGKYKYQWVSVRGTKKDAEKRRTELLHQLDNGTFMKPGKTTLAEYLERWLKDYARPKLSPRSYDRYADIIKRYLNPGIGNVPLTQLKPAQLQELYSAWLHKGLSNRTVRYHHAVIHIALKSAVKWGMVGRSVADAVEVPKGQRKEMQVWNQDEVAHFLETAKDSPYYALYYLAVFTGARRSELLALTWQDVDLLLSQISISRGLHQLRDNSFVFSQPKSAKSRRTIALPPSASLVLKAHHDKQAMDRAMLGFQLTDNGLVFSTIEGKPIRPNTITRAWTSFVGRSGLKAIRFHDLRHTHASLMLTQGIHPKIVQERLGHASIQMTLDTYSHVAPGLQQVAAESFDRLLNGKREIEAVKNHY